MNAYAVKAVSSCMHWRFSVPFRLNVTRERVRAVAQGKIEMNGGWVRTCTFQAGLAGKFVRRECGRGP